MRTYCFFKICKTFCKKIGQNLHTCNFYSTFVVLLIPGFYPAPLSLSSRVILLAFFFSSFFFKKSPIIFAYIKEKQYLCTRIMDFERRSNDGQATVKRQSKPTCSQRCPENKPKFMYYTILYIYIYYTILYIYI